MPRAITTDIGQAGSQVGTIPVSIGYRIIELFSGHLYSNPAKAIEELVVNAYDAFAETCIVVVPDDWDVARARVLVWDDGDSMDLEGFNELWLVAETRKRDPDREAAAIQRGRLPVGKFGIGKLASYVLGKRITHICKRGKEYLAVTMDFSQVVPEGSPRRNEEGKAKQIDLPVRSLTKDEAQELLAFATSGELPGGVKLPLFSKEAPKNWTLVVIDGLKVKDGTTRIPLGRLRWIISTALPLVPDFRVSLNGEEISPSRESRGTLRTWRIGDDDSIAKDKGYEVGDDPSKPKPFDTYVIIPGVGPVSGQFTLYEDTLLGGKAGEVGRSHGFFIMVRRRLINHEDPLFGIHPLSHATFNRLHAVVHADGLDRFLVASREDVAAEARNALKAYLTVKFTEIRGWYEDYQKRREKKEGVEDRLAGVPSPLVRFPLRHALDRAIHDKGVIPRALRLPPLVHLAMDLIKGFALASMDSTEPIAIFDAATGIVKINVNHPYYVNFSDSPDMEAFAASEILLEAYLYETDLPPDEVQALLTKRDDLQRALVRSKPRSVTLIAERLRDSAHAEKDLEEGCHAAFAALGCDVVPMGGSGKPDGIATAILGVKYLRGGRGQVEDHSYKVTYDAKSSEDDRVKSTNLGLATVARHRDENDAKYAIVVAPDFETTEGEESKAVKEARREEVCLIRVDDLADLVDASGVKPLSLERLEGLFSECRSPENSHEWVQNFVRESEPRPDLAAIFETIHRLQEENRTELPSFGAIKYNHPKLKDASERDIKGWVQAVARLLPDLIRIYGERVELLQSPDYVLTQYHQLAQTVLRRLPGAEGQSSPP